jgi:hypothetical protein
LNTNSIIEGIYSETLHWATTEDGFQSTIALINYFGWAFPAAGKHQTDADVVIRFFDHNGQELEPFKSTIETGQSFHFTIGSHLPRFEGLIAVNLIPHGKMARKSASSDSPGRPIATSYFTLYERYGNFADFSHELFLLRKNINVVPQEWATVLFFDHELSPALIIMNNCDSQERPQAASEVSIQLFKMNGHPVSEINEFSLQPRGSKRLLISECFPDMAFDGIDQVTVTVTGTNIEQPMSLHLHESGDFNLHHF